MKKEYIQPKAKDVKIEMATLIAMSVGKDETPYTGGDEGIGAKDESMDFDW